MKKNKKIEDIGSLKIVVVGDSKVGKTCLLISFANNSFPDDYVPTVFDNYGSVIQSQFRNSRASFGLWDTASHEDYGRLRPLCYPESDFFLVLFSLVDTTSLESVKKWVDEAREYCVYVPLILVGTKCDLPKDDDFMSQFMECGKELCQHERILELGKDLKLASYISCSAKTQERLHYVFEKITEFFHFKLRRDEKNPSGISSVFKSIFKKSGNSKSKSLKHRLFDENAAVMDWRKQINEFRKAQKQLSNNFAQQFQAIRKKRKEKKSHTHPLGDICKDVVLYILTEFVVVDTRNLCYFDHRYLLDENFVEKGRKFDGLFEFFGKFPGENNVCQIYANFIVKCYFTDSKFLPVNRLFIQAKYSDNVLIQPSFYYDREEYFSKAKTHHVKRIENMFFKTFKVRMNDRELQDLESMTVVINKKSTLGNFKYNYLDKTEKIQKFVSSKLKKFSKLTLKICDLEKREITDFDL